MLKTTRTRLRWVALAAVLITAACMQRKPPETVPNATLPDGTPLVRPDTGPKPRVIQPTPRDLEPKFHTALMLDFHPVTARSWDGIFRNPDLQRNMISIEALLEPLRGRGVGVAARGLFSGGASPTYSDINLLLGSRSLSGELGFASRRSFNRTTGAQYDSIYTVFKPGIRSRVNIGDTPFSVTSRAAYYVGLPEAAPGASARFRGYHIEGGLSWTLPIGKIPWTGNLGFRREEVRLFDRRQDATSIYFGGGVLIGRRPVGDAPPRRLDPQ